MKAARNLAWRVANVVRNAGDVYAPDARALEIGVQQLRRVDEAFDMDRDVLRGAIPALVTVSAAAMAAGDVGLLRDCLVPSRLADVVRAVGQRARGGDTLEARVLRFDSVVPLWVGEAREPSDEGGGAALAVKARVTFVQRMAIWTEEGKLAAGSDSRASVVDAAVTVQRPIITGEGAGDGPLWRLSDVPTLITLDEEGPLLTPDGELVVSE